MTAVDSGPYASDISDKSYTVVNHKDRISKEYAFTINSANLDTKIKCKKTTEIPSEINREA